MENSKKLRRYSRKVYTQLVDFPVEIVGRDGVIRRYGFEASIRLYQRRIASASSRYEDVQVVDAEVRHCRLRIEQLRKSYFHRFGWSGIQRDDSPGALAGEYAGEVAAFLRRFYGGDPVDLDVRWVADLDHGQNYFVRRSTGPGYLLYLFRFETYGACDGREAFFALLRVLQRAQGQDVESLVAFHHSADCGLVLSAMGEHAGVAPELIEPEPLPEPDAYVDGPYGQGLRLLSEGEPVRALALFERAQADNGYHRQAALAACIVADLLGRPDQAETAARIACHHLSDDAVLRYHLGLALMRGLQLDEAQAELETALRRDPRQAAANIAYALVLAQRRGPALPALRRAMPLAAKEDPDALAALQRARSGLIGQRLAWLLAPVTLGLAVLAGWFDLTALGVAAVLTSMATLAGSLAGLIGRRGIDLRTLRLQPPESLGARGPKLDDIVS
jgi:tetratricopeptide (TPR) repeat protein